MLVTVVARSDREKGVLPKSWACRRKSNLVISVPVLGTFSKESSNLLLNDVLDDLTLNLSSPLRLAFSNVLYANIPVLRSFI